MERDLRAEGWGPEDCYPETEAGSNSAVERLVMPDGGKGGDCPLRAGDRVKIIRLIPPEDLPIGSKGTVVQWDDICTEMLMIDWDAGWRGLYWPKDLQRA